MIYKFLYTLLGMSLVLGFSSCEKDGGGLLSTTFEGYLQLDVIVNPMIHPYAQTASLKIDEVRINDEVIEDLLSTEKIVIDSDESPARRQFGSRAVLTPGGYANLDIDFMTVGSEACYVSMYEGNFDRLQAGVADVHSIRASGSFLIENGTTKKCVLFLDLNKLVKVNQEGQVDFSFRQNLLNSNAARVYDPKEVGHIKGSVVRTLATPRQTHRLIAYAYPSGTFRQHEEIDNGFTSAFISANVRRNDQFSFPVLPEGPYDLVIAQFKDDNLDGVLEFKNLLQADAEVNMTTRMTRVSKNTETLVELQLGGVVVD